MKSRKIAMNKFLRWKPDTKVVAIFAMLALAFLLIPLLRISVYSVPWYDDYNYGKFAKNFLEQEASLKSLWDGLIYCVKTQWYAWQGTYSSIFFMTLMPGVWGEDKYFLGSLFLITLLLVAVFVLVKVLVVNVFQGDMASCVILQAVTAILVIVLVHRSQLAFYWYNAGVHYVGMHSFCLLFVAASIRLLQVRGHLKKIVLMIGTMLGALIVAGSNYVTSLQSGILLLTIIVVGCFVYRKNSVKILWLLPALVVYGVGFYMNVTAPGNQVRSANFVGWGLGSVQSVIQSFVEAAKHLGEFTGCITVVIIILLIPVIWNMVGRTSFSFRLPGLVLLWSICMYATGFTPSLYSIGQAGLSRTLNAVKITYQLLLILNEIYWLGWFYGFLEKRQKPVLTGKVFWWFYPIMGMLMLFVFCMEPDKVGTYSSYGAFQNVHSGEAYNFYQQYLERVEILEGEESTVILEPYRYQPWVICAGDLAEDPQSGANRAIANWYGKEAVICKDE